MSKYFTISGSFSIENTSLSKLEVVNSRQFTIQINKTNVFYLIRPRENTIVFHFSYPIYVLATNAYNDSEKIVNSKTRMFYMTGKRLCQDSIVNTSKILVRSENHKTKKSYFITAKFYFFKDKAPGWKF